MQNTYPVPLVLKCTITGREVKYYSRPYIEKRIAKAGDLATLINTFMAKGAKKQKSPPSSKTWKGEEIIKTNAEDANKASAVTTNVGEKVYTFSDGGHCRVVYPN